MSNIMLFYFTVTQKKKKLMIKNPKVKMTVLVNLGHLKDFKHVEV